ncbi:MAG TPA: antibiotic biosynthesis monooxygenase family protein [Methylibium sp.]
MILEVADIRIKPGQQAEFDRAIQHGIETVISKAAGFRGYKIKRGIESPERYLLMIWWDTLENHMVDFRESDAFGQWRAIVGPYFAHPPVVEHFTLLASSAPRG